MWTRELNVLQLHSIALLEGGTSLKTTTRKIVPIAGPASSFLVFLMFKNEI